MTTDAMRLHWSPRSPYVRKVMVAAHELGLADRIRTVRTLVTVARPNAELLPENPLSKIPTLVLPDGAVVFDSVVICEVLDALAGGGRLFPPAPGPERWAALTRHALGNGLLDALLLWRAELTKDEPLRQPELLDSFAVKARATLDHLERDAPALSAARFGIGHIATGVALAYLDFRFADLDWRAGRPALAEWHAGFAARPSARATEFAEG